MVSEMKGACSHLGFLVVRENGPAATFSFVDSKGKGYEFGFLFGNIASIAYCADVRDVDDIDGLGNLLERCQSVRHQVKWIERRTP